MSHLEDRIMRILELKASGLDENAIAGELGLEVYFIEMYEESTKKGIQTAIENGMKGLAKIANYVGLSLITTEMFSRIYGISIPTAEEGRTPNETQEIEELGHRRYRTMKESKEEIRKGVSEGLSVDDIAKKLELSHRAIRSYSSKFKIQLPIAGRKLKTMERIENIRKLAGAGLSREEIMRELGLSYNILSYYSNKENITLPMSKRRGRPAIRKENLQRALTENTNSLEELCKRTGVKTGYGAMRLCKKFNIKLPDNLIPYKQWPKVDILIEKGYSMYEMAREVRLSRERIRQYINGSGQYNDWRKKRQEVKEELGIGKKANQRKIKDLQGRLISALWVRAEELAKKEDWAFQKAVEYLRSYKANYPWNHTFPQLYKLFKVYERAQKKGKKLSLEKIGEKVDLYGTSVDNILARIGIEPMYGKKEQIIKKRREKMEATIRGVDTCFSSSDIAYFLNLPDHVPYMRFQNMGIKRGRNIWLRVGKDWFTYRLASQIYEARDCGFSGKDVMELLDVKGEIVDYALEHRRELEPKIVKGIRILYNDKKIKNPYVTKRMKERLEKR